MKFRRYNQKINNNEGYQPEILRQLFEHLGENPYIEYNFRCEFGFNIKIGDNVLINHDLIILDCNQVTIGDNVYFGPRCGLFAANHSEDPAVRTAGGVYSKPITVGNQVWLGANVSLLPGVTIGDNCIIGAGSVVTKDIPANVVAAGNPCQVIRTIRIEDQEWIKKDKIFIPK